MRYLIIPLTVLCTTFGYLSYHFYGSKREAEGDLRVAQASLIALQSSLDKKEQECKINDELSAEWQKEKQEVDKEKESDIQKIDKIPKKPSQQPKAEDQNNEIDIDSKLPDSLVRLLDEAFNRNN